MLVRPTILPIASPLARAVSWQERSNGLNDVFVESRWARRLEKKVPARPCIQPDGVAGRINGEHHELC